MANVNAPFGFRAVQTDNGAAYNGTITKYYIAASDSSGAIFPGDPVIVDGSSDSTGMIASVTKATAGSNGYTTGVVAYFDHQTTTDLDYRAASTARYVYVYDDPDMLFEIQADGTNAVTDVSNTVDFSFGLGGNTATALSGAVLVSTNVGTGTQLKIEKFSNVIDNDISSAYPKFFVRFALHEKRRATGV